MTIANATPAAGLTGLVQSEQAQYTLFGPSSQSQTSAQFPVDQHPVFVSAYNLAGNDVITIYQVVGQGSGTEAAPFSPVYGPLVLNPNITKVRIDYPGRYYCVHTGASSLGTFTVLAAPATMTSDSLAGLAQALTAVIVNQGLTVQGTVPILVTGQGTVGNPYVVAFQSNTVVGAGEISVTGVGTTATPYSVSIPTYSSTSLGTTGETRLGVGATNAASSSTAVGSGATNAAAGGTAVGAGATTTGAGSTALGGGADANSVNAVAVGSSSTASGGSSVAVGVGANANGGTTVGWSSTANAGDTAVGSSASATGGDSVAVGQGANATGANAIVMGLNSTATNNTSLAIGSAAHSTAVAGLAIGDGTTASATAGIAMGSGATASHANEIAIGALAAATNTHVDTITIASAGSATNPTQDHQIVLGTSTNTQLVTAGSIIQGGVISASDERLKIRVAAEWNPLEAVNALDPVTFYWDREALDGANIPMNEDEYGKKQHGLIAQEVEKVFPEFVEHVNRGNGVYKFVRYERLIPVLIAALQELSLKVEALENRQ